MDTPDPHAEFKPPASEGPDGQGGALAPGATDSGVNDATPGPEAPGAEARVIEAGAQAAGAAGPEATPADGSSAPLGAASAPATSAPARRLPPSQRWRRRDRGRAFGASVGGHGALAGFILGLMLVAGGPKGDKPPPPLPPGATPTPTPIPVVWVAPLAPATPEPPAPPGDFPVPQSALPSALPSLDSSPEPLPSSEPSLEPTPAPSLAPMARPRPRPTPRYATPRPLPPLPTLAPLRPLPTPRANRPTAEQRQFATMRKFKYFEDMTDEELRRQPLPPGVSSWDQLPKVVGKLDGLNWLFLPRETANRQDGFSSGTGLVQAGPDGMASGVGPAQELPATMAAIEPGKPYEELSPDGQHLLVVREANVFLFATWKTGDQEMLVRYRPEGSQPEDPEREFKAPVAATQAGREQAVREGFVAAAFEDAASAAPAGP